MERRGWGVPRSALRRPTRPQRDHFLKFHSLPCVQGVGASYGTGLTSRRVFPNRGAQAPSGRTHSPSAQSRIGLGRKPKTQVQKKNLGHPPSLPPGASGRCRLTNPSARLTLEVRAVPIAGCKRIWIKSHAPTCSHVSLGFASPERCCSGARSDRMYGLGIGK